MIRSILVPLDGSEFSEQALPTAGAIARREGAVLRLVSVHVPAAILPFGGSMPIEAEAERRARDRAEARLSRIARWISEDYGVPVTHEVLDGPVVETIDRYARESGADLIAMTTHGRGAFKRLVAGSVAEAVLHGSSAHMLLYRPEHPASS
jgi:nucleotide-binding universal stress UspA family protein